MTEGPRTAEMLRLTRPWVRFLSIMGFIAVGLMTIGGILLTAAGAAQAQGQMIAIGVVYLFVAAVYVVPALLLGRYASRIADYLSRGTGDALDTALEAQKSFWKFVGVLTIVVLCIYALAIAGFVVIAIITAASAGP